MSARQSITRTFLKGLVVVLPVAVLIATLYWVGSAMEALLRMLFLPFLPSSAYIPGMGLLLGILLCYLVGVLMNTAVAPRIVMLWHRLLERIPLVKSIYGAVEDIIDSLSPNRTQRFNRVVKIRYPQSDFWLVGFVTREDLSALPDGLNNADQIAVYLPMSYQIGGYMILVPKSMVEPIDLSIEDASRLVLTAGLSIHKTPKSE